MLVRPTRSVLSLAIVLAVVGVGLSGNDAAAPETRMTAAASGADATSVRYAVGEGRTVVGPDPFAGSRLYVDPASDARREADTLRASQPARAALFDKIAGQGQADWFGDWIGESAIRAAVSTRVDTIRGAGALPVLVVYAIPGRDCGSYSAGGLPTAEAYRRWIAAFAAGLGEGPAAVVLEPDALAQLDCLSTTQRTERLALLADAVTALGRTGAAVYLDAGNPRWHAPAVMASRLKAANVAGARGFSLNVSNFLPTDENVRYGSELSGLVGGRSFVVDTSRNGLGPTADLEWCNPDGRALGRRPGADLQRTDVDAYLWIKRPGESDGTCNGGPAAGRWWPGYAEGLAGRASW